jgi:hypothetical protein
MHEPYGEKHLFFVVVQETICKDDERCFGALQSQFAIVQNPTKIQKRNAILNIHHACVIVQNTITEDESIMGLEPCFPKVGVHLDACYHLKIFRMHIRN